MSDLLIYIYRYFRRRKTIFYLFTALATLVVLIPASRIGFKENISQSVNGRDPGNRLGFVLQHLQISDKIIVDISLLDSLAPADPGYLVEIGQMFVDSLSVRFDSSTIQNVSFRASDSAMTTLTDLVMQHLPIFYLEEDYTGLDTLLLPGSIARAMDRNFKILSSPASMLLKKRIRQDPLGVSNIAISKLKSLKFDENFDVYDGCVITSDLKHLLIFIQPASPSSETSRNDKLITGLDEIVNVNKKGPHSNFRIQYFGGTAVAVSNARQLKKDIMLTLAIAVSLILLLVGWYFKSIRVPVLGLLPALFGGTLALAILFIAKGHISSISLGIGSVILGLIVDYSLYLVNHFRRKQDIILTIKEMSLTIFLCSLTSAGAFLCLTFLNSVVLQDLGWFAAISVMGAAIFTLVILPQLLGSNLLHQDNSNRITIIDRLAATNYERKVWLIVTVVFAVVLGTWWSGKVLFETNMSSLSFVTPELARAEADLDKISNYKLKNVYLVAMGQTPEQALRQQEKFAVKLQEMKIQGIIRGTSNAGPLLTSDSLQRLRIARWNNYWTEEKKQQLKKDLDFLAQKTGFRSSAFEAFFKTLDTGFQPLSLGDPSVSNNPILDGWLSINKAISLAPTILKVTDDAKSQVYREFPPDPGYVLFDRQKLTEQFVENVKLDFDLLVKLSMIFVTILLVVSFGRLGLGLMTAMPMFLSWIITLGFMGVTGTRFNIFNIIISSFIFGLGVDYSILMMRGLQNKLKYGGNDLATYKVAILLSSITTLIGVGVLLFARHPALSSIAVVSVVGIVSVVVISFVVQPFLFNHVILTRARNKKFPVTCRILVKTLITWGNIVAISLALMILGTLINYLLPLKRKKKEMIFHHMFYWLTKAYIAFTFAFDRKLENEHGEDFKKPAIIISNHQSLIETPAFLRLYPKIIILTTSWVYRSPIFGPIARLANFYNVDDGIDSIIGLLQEKVNEGFSILIFPEAHRSADQKIQRFHRGAFYLAGKLKTDILPVLVYGTGDFLGKGAFWGRPNSFRMKIMKRVSHDDISFGMTYQERARLFRQFYISAYARYKAEEGDASYYRRLLALNFVLKGPVLEWYMRVKMKLESNYEIYNRLLPRQGEILDLGCGYGFISYMLMFTSDERMVTGVDYDDEKISVASNCFSKNSRINFITMDVSNFEITPKKGFLLSDVLHYLEPSQQEELLHKCFANLLPGGSILVREANSDLTGRHKRSRITEFFSTRTGFNKTTKPGKELFFTSSGKLEAIAAAHGFRIEVIDNKKITSNNLFLLTREPGIED